MVKTGLGFVNLGVCVGSRTGWKRGEGQQEDKNRAASHSIGGEERRGAEQVAWRRDDC